MATVDILMATYNGERFVRAQIESIQAQTYRDWRLLISDDCSEDETLAVIHEMSRSDSRIEIVSAGVRYGSARENFMHLISLSEAPYVMFCDQDDVWLLDKIERTLARMNEIEGDSAQDAPLLVFADMRVVGEDLSVMSNSFMELSAFDPTRLNFSQLVAHNVAAGCTMMMNAPLLRLCLQCKDASRIAMHDWWAMLVAAAFGTISYINAPLSLYRQHDSNEVGAAAYSPVARAGNQSAMLECYLSTVRQAELFRYVFAEKMSSWQVKVLDEYVAASKARSFVRGVSHLCKSGCWKRGERKLGQIVMVGKCVMANKSGEM